MIDIDRAEGFSPFRVWARGGQAPLRAQATLAAGRAVLVRGPRRGGRAARRKALRKLKRTARRPDAKHSGTKPQP